MKKSKIKDPFPKKKRYYISNKHDLMLVSLGITSLQKTPIYVVPTKDAKSIAFTEGNHIYVTKECIKRKDFLGILIHEFFHIVFRHCKDSRLELNKYNKENNTQIKYHHDLHNVATDIFINEIIKNELKITMDDCLYRDLTGTAIADLLTDPVLPKTVINAGSTRIYVELWIRLKDKLVRFKYDDPSQDNKEESEEGEGDADGQGGSDGSGDSNASKAPKDPKDPKDKKGKPDKDEDSDDGSGEGSSKVKESEEDAEDGDNKDGQNGKGEDGEDGEGEGKGAGETDHAGEGDIVDELSEGAIGKDGQPGHSGLRSQGHNTGRDHKGEGGDEIDNSEWTGEFEEGSDDDEDVEPFDPRILSNKELEITKIKIKSFDKEIYNIMKHGLDNFCRKSLSRTWGRPNRRQLPLAGKQNNIRVSRIFLYLDASGSMQNSFKLYREICRSLGKRLTMMVDVVQMNSFDTKIYHINKNPGGGTEYAPLFKDKDPRRDSVIVITDGGADVTEWKKFADKGGKSLMFTLEEQPPTDIPTKVINLSEFMI